MKKLNYLFLGLAGLAMASCSNDDLEGIAGGDGNVQVVISLPEELGTRAFEQANFPKTLQYAVYNVTDPSNPTLSLTSSVDLAAGVNSTTISLNLLPEKSYALAFFAQAAEVANGGVYNFNAEDKTLTVDYSAMAAAANNQDYYDCFFGVKTTDAISVSNSTFSVQLTRPMAQINWGTNDIGTTQELTNTFGASGQYIESTLKSSTAFNNTINLLTGAVGNSGNAASEIPAFTIPTGESYPVQGYTYMALQYLLAPADGTTCDLSLEISNQVNGNTAAAYSNTINVNNVPVRANYRTNLYGSLLSIGSNVTIDIQPGFAGGSDQALTWDGTETAPTVVGQTVSVNQPSDLAGFAAMVNGDMALPSGVTSSDFAGYTIVLGSDFDMANKEFPQIGATSRSSGSASGKSFKGVLDGNGHTISNMKIQGSSNAKDAVGFISNLDGSGAQLKDLTFENLQIEASSNEQAGVVGMLTNGASVTNVHVTSGSVTANEGAGGIVGRMTYSGTILGCSNGATIHSGTNGGGIVGAAYYTADGTSMKVTNCNNTGTVTGTSNAIGGIVGLSCAEVSGCTNSGAITGGSSSTGGVVGEQKSAGSVTGCVNMGNVTVVNAASGTYGTGGVVGWVRYDNGAAYSRQNLISVTGCTNYGSVTGGMTGVGGIVGMWYMCGNCSNNYNYAPKLAGSSMIAGIVGGSQWTESNPTGFNSSGLPLTVNYNQSSTLPANMTGANQADFVYINDTQKTTQTGNSIVEPKTPPTN